MEYFGIDLSSEFIYLDFIASLQAWHDNWGGHGGQQQRHGRVASGDNADDNNINECDKEQSGQAVPGHGHSEIVSLPTNFRCRWVQHFEADELEQPNRRILKKQRSIVSLEEKCVGSFDHLSGLSLEQLQEMEQMVHEHDAKYWEESERQVLPLEWLDTLCS